MSSAQAARATLTIIAAAQPLQDDLMFPEYKHADELCRSMLASLKAWPDHDRDFLKDVVVAFQNEDTKLGMQLVMERVHFYIPGECNWGYLDD